MFDSRISRVPSLNFSGSSTTRGNHSSDQAAGKQSTDSQETVEEDWNNPATNPDHPSRRGDQFTKNHKFGIVKDHRIGPDRQKNTYKLLKAGRTPRQIERETAQTRWTIPVDKITKFVNSWKR